VHQAGNQTKNNTEFVNAQKGTRGLQIQEYKKIKK
jgi:hypothetical protein